MHLILKNHNNAKQNRQVNKKLIPTYFFIITLQPNCNYVKGTNVPKNIGTGSSTTGTVPEPCCGIPAPRLTSSEFSLHCMMR